MPLFSPLLSFSLVRTFHASCFTSCCSKIFRSLPYVFFLPLPLPWEQPSKFRLKREREREADVRNEALNARIREWKTYTLAWKSACGANSLQTYKRLSARERLVVCKISSQGWQAPIDISVCFSLISSMPDMHARIHFFENSLQGIIPIYMRRVFGCVFTCIYVCVCMYVYTAIFWKMREVKHKISDFSLDAERRGTHK